MLSEEVICTCHGSGALDGHARWCGLLTGLSPAEEQRQREALRTKEYFSELSEPERLYQQVKAKLDAKEQEHVERLRQRRLAGDDGAHYGHDLWAAVKRGQLREQQASAEALLEKVREDRRGSEAVVFAGAVRAVVAAAAARGVSAEDMRKFLNNIAGARDSSRLERVVDEHGPKGE